MPVSLEVLEKAYTGQLEQTIACHKQLQCMMVKMVVVVAAALGQAQNERCKGRLAASLVDTVLLLLLLLDYPAGAYDVQASAPA